MTESSLACVLWGATAAAGIVYAAMFLLARRPASVRLVRVGAALAAVLVIRLALLAAGFSLIRPWEFLLAGLTVVAAVGLCLARRYWLIRGSEEEFLGGMREACRGLLLDHEEPAPGRFLLKAKEGAWELRLRRVGARMQLAFVPSPPERGKAALFVQWLSKQYPGPMPRVRIVLSRSQP